MTPLNTLKAEIRAFVVKNFLFGVEEGLTDDGSFLEQGIIDSTGVLELVSYIEARYGITVDSNELTPDNLDSIESVASFLHRKSQTLSEHRSVG